MAIYGTRVVLRATYYGFAKWEKEEEPQDVEIEFSRIVQNEKVEKIVAALVNAKIAFRYDPSNGYGADSRTKITFGWYAPPVADVLQLIQSHGFTVERKNKVIEGSEDITEKVMRGEYRPLLDKEAEAAQA